jgi:hypothetical protein
MNFHIVICRTARAPASIIICCKDAAACPAVVEPANYGDSALYYYKQIRWLDKLSCVNISSSFVQSQLGLENRNLMRCS